MSFIFIVMVLILSFMRIFYLVLAHFHFLLNLPILRLYGLCGTETLLQPLEGREQ